MNKTKNNNFSYDEFFDRIKEVFRKSISPEYRKQTAVGGIFFAFLIFFVFTPGMHRQINQIRRIQPSRSYHPGKDTIEKAHLIEMKLNCGDYSGPDEIKAEQELEQLLPLGFDVNKYFDILDRLEMEDNYLLDYHYHLNSLEGNPILYARRKNEKRDLSCSGTTPSHLQSQYNYYLSHIKTDGSREGFIQLAILHLIGGNFYFYWHSNYDDLDIYSRIPAWVTFYPDEVSVTLFVNTFHQLVQRYTLRVKRKFPHEFIAESRRTVIPYLRSVRL